MKYTPDTPRQLKINDIPRFIVCSANKYEDKIVMGVRHYCPLMHQNLESLPAGLESKVDQARQSSDDVQGFIDQWGNWISRQDALYIAQLNGQYLDIEHGRSYDKLYSESLYHIPPLNKTNEEVIRKIHQAFALASNWMKQDLLSTDDIVNATLASIKRFVGKKQEPKYIPQEKFEAIVTNIVHTNTQSQVGDYLKTLELVKTAIHESVSLNTNRVSLDLFEAVIKEMSDGTSMWGIDGTCEQPKGTSETRDSIFQIIYIDQSFNSICDSYSGHIYFPLPTGDYLKCWFNS